MNPLTFNPAATDAWLRQPCPAIAEATRAECLGVDEEGFGPDLDGFLSTLDDILAAGPAGLDRRADITDVLLWLIPDGDILDQGALITVDLVNGIRLASPHQGVTAFADRGRRGIPAALAALDHIVDQVCLLVASYQHANPSYQPPACGRPLPPGTGTDHARGAPGAAEGRPQILSAPATGRSHHTKPWEST